MTLIRVNDPYTDSFFSFKHRLKRACWGLTWRLFFRPSPRICHAWRAALLRLFGAQVGRHCHVYPNVRVWAPWNLKLGDYVGIGDGVNLYCMSEMTVGNYAVISQGAHLCGGTHDYNVPTFDLIARPIRVGDLAWVCSEAFLHAGASVPTGTVIGARSVVRPGILDEWAVYAGNPARKIALRTRFADEENRPN